MLSISTIKSASSAYSYYEADNYYAKDSPEAREASHWWGEGAKALGLQGYVEPEVFKTLLEGLLPSGQQLGRIEKGEIVHRPGLDLTFSAPKSVSVLSEVGQDKRIHMAHDKAVNEALSYLEHHAAQTRRSEEGKIIFEDTNNFIVAKFRHDTSREQDPQLHTHCVVINATLRKDNQWRSLSGEKLFEQKMLGGLIYRSSLAIELQKLGYEIEKTHADGRFEISRVPQTVIDIFSKRRVEIEKALEERGLEGAKASEIATLDTRQSKQTVERELLHQSWEAQCQQLGFDVRKVMETSYEKVTLLEKEKLLKKEIHQNIQKNTVNLEAQKSLRYALNHLSEREAVFTHQVLLTTTLAHGLGKVSLNEIEQEILQSEKRAELILRNLPGIETRSWTTPEAIKLEQDTIHQMLEGRYAVKPISAIEKVEPFLSHQIDLKEGQKEAVKLILTSPDRIIGIQGYAGTGKTTMLSLVKEFSNKQGFEVKGIAPSATAANQLREGASIESQTLESYLIEQTKQGDYVKSASKVIYVLDESSMASTRKMNELLKSIHRNQGRLVLVGDTKQLGAIEAGKPFYQLQKAGMETAIMKEIQRQKDPKLLQAVHEAIKGDIQKALDKIGDKVIEIENKRERLEKIANDYLALLPKERQSTLVLTPANEDRTTVNQLIREGLKKENYLKGGETQSTILVNRGLTQAEKIQIDNYTIGTIIRFNKTYSSLKVKAGDYVEVTHIDKEGNKLIIKNSKNQLIEWFPYKVGGKRAGAIEVYQVEQRALMVGDTIRWQRNDKQEGIINSEVAKVVSINHDKVTVELQNDKTLKLNLSHKNHQHWDYAYATTVHAAQGKTCDRVIAHGESFRKNLTNQHSFYVTISRARHEAYIYTDNKENYLKTLNQYLGEKTSAITLNNKPPEKSFLLSPSSLNKTFTKEMTLDL